MFYILILARHAGMMLQAHVLMMVLMVLVVVLLQFPFDSIAIS